MDEMTPIMGPGEMQAAQALSLDRLRPPVSIPGFEQKEFLGRGSFGEVWKAIDSNNGRLVAIKYFTRGGSIDWSHMAREVEKLRYLFSDRYVVQLFDVGWDSDPPFYVMEYMERGSLEDLLRQGTLSVADSLQIILGVGQGLVRAHDKGILHCDLKPANIMLDQDGQPRLADFGQARLRHDQTPSLGTLFYMAPEQADLTAMPDARWDVYALGVMLYRMVTGELPYRIQATETTTWSQGPLEDRLKRYRELIAAAPRPRAHRSVDGVDKQLAEIIDRCLQINPKRRYHNVQAVISDLDNRASRLAKRPLWIVGGLGPIVVALVLALVAAVVFRNSISMASAELLSRTRESNSFAAESVAARLALEVDRRWRILEHEAKDPRWPAWLAAQTDSAQASSDGSALHAWMAEKHQSWNNQFGSMGKSAYWFVLDRRGRLLSISAFQPQLIGSYYGYRDYFHGQGRELSPTAEPPEPITHVYRSAVYRSQPENVLAVAFSVPIRQGADESGEIIGVLVMETILSHISEFHGNRKQAAVLIDLRPDERGRPGLVVDHPGFDGRLSGPQTAENFYLDASTLEKIDTIHRAHEITVDVGTQSNEAAGDSMSTASTASTIVDAYDDPVTNLPENDFYAAVEPVFITRGGESRYDSGWAILIQERRAETLAPLARVWRIFVIGGAIGVATVVALLVALWAFVFLILNRPRSSLLRKLRGQPPGSSITSSNLASGSSAYGSTRGSLR